MCNVMVNAGGIPKVQNRTSLHIKVNTLIVSIYGGIRLLHRGNLCFLFIVPKNFLTIYNSNSDAISCYKARTQLIQINADDEPSAPLPYKSKSRYASKYSLRLPGFSLIAQKLLI